MNDLSPATVLRRAAEAYRNGDIEWGRDFFVRPSDSCRCAAGAIAYAVDPEDREGDPRWVDAEGIALDAVQRLADYLGDTFPIAVADDPIETVGEWNDDPARTPDQVIAALEAASERAW